MTLKNRKRGKSWKSEQKCNSNLDDGSDSLASNFKKNQEKNQLFFFLQTKTIILFKHDVSDYMAVEWTLFGYDKKLSSQIDIKLKRKAKS